MGDHFHPKKLYHATVTDHAEMVTSISQVQQNNYNGPMGYAPEAAEEKARSRTLNRKLDIALCPFLSLLYLFNGLDRGNVG